LRNNWQVTDLEAVIRKGGLLELPNSILSEIGLCEGRRVALTVKDGEIHINPVKRLTEQLIGSIKLEDQKLIKEIIESDDWLR
jgi:antitoxin component of MazEF toxin-antitoxin module